MATNQSFQNMLNQKIAKPKKKPQVSGWLEMCTKKGK